MYHALWGSAYVGWSDWMRKLFRDRSAFHPTCMHARRLWNATSVHAWTVVFHEKNMVVSRVWWLALHVRQYSRSHPCMPSSLSWSPLLFRNIASGAAYAVASSRQIDVASIIPPSTRQEWTQSKFGEKAIGAQQHWS